MSDRLQSGSRSIPARAGIGLRHVHFRELLETLPDIGWLEAHSENFFGDGGQPLWFLDQLREEYPISLHGVGLGLGSADPLDPWHLKRLKGLCDRVEPALLSEHLCWNHVNGEWLNDLLPLPYTEEAARHVSQRISELQDFLGRQVLIENLSSYLEYNHSTMPEWEFLVAIARTSGCGILLDVNNIHVNAMNHGFDPHDYLDAIPVELVAEIHLAGYEERDGILIDSHSRPVSTAVWRLYDRAWQRFGPVPTLIEWDADIPDLDVLLQEAYKADGYAEADHALSA